VTDSNFFIARKIAWWKLARRKIAWWKLQRNIAVADSNFIARKIAWWLPRRVAYWCTLRVIAHATQGLWSNQNASTLLAMEALNRWYPIPGDAVLIRLWLQKKSTPPSS
jgi:hypothetical protein